MTTQRVSVIIEWENVLLSEIDRCREMLRQLHRQIHELERQRAESKSNSLAWLTFPFQVLFVHDANLVPAEVIQREIERIIQPGDACIRAELAPSTGLHYYELKNFGAQRAKGDLLLFLDSDVIPEPDWLRTLLSAFDHPEVEVASGTTYVDSSTLVGKAFALSWLFPVRSSETSLVTRHTFHANNVVFRKQTFQRFPFPKLEGTARGSCRRLAARLRQHGIGIYYHQGARVSHPPPNGLRHFIVRGIAHGRDDVFRGRVVRKRSGFVPESRSLARHLFHGVARNLGSIMRNRKKVGLSPAQTPLAAGLALGYCHLRLLGALMTLLHPRFMKDHFRI